MLNTRAHRTTACNADDTSIHDCGVANGGSLKFGFQLSGHAEACAFGICLGVDISVSRGLAQRQPGGRELPRRQGPRLRRPAVRDACATIKVATIRLPGTISPENDPNLAELQSAILLLNVGSRGTLRVV